MADVNDPKDTEEDVAPAEAPLLEAPPPARPRKRRFLIWAAVLFVFVGGFWLAMRAGNKPANPHAGAPPPVTVITATATQRDLPIYLSAIGTVTPIHTSSITSQVTGRVVAVRYKEGQMVHTGTPLVDIDARPLQATLQQSQGTLEHDEHVLSQARMDLERYRAAWEKHAIARQQLDDQEKLVLQTEGTVKFDRGVVDYNKVQLGYASITSPIDGRVGLRLIDPGNVVAANGTTVLAVITQLQPISVVFAISEDSLSDVLAQPNHGEGLAVEVLDRVKAKQLATGKLITIDNQIDTTTGTVRLRALFDNADQALFPNQFVNTRLLVRTVKMALVVPSSAIQHNGQEAFVYVVHDGKAQLQRVTTGVVAGELTQVTGIAAGTVVANSSFEKLRDGSPIAVAPPATQASNEWGASP